MNFCPERLIQLRTSLNINKAEAARRLNISAMAYGRYERGEREIPLDIAVCLAKYYNISLDYISGIIDSPRPLLPKSKL